MDNLIFIDVLTFSNKAYIQVYKAGMNMGVSCSLGELSQKVANLSATYGINNIQISGSNKFLQKYVEDIHAENKKNYANFNLKIEVIPV